jgi:hypothetical protein
MGTGTPARAGVAASSRPTRATHLHRAATMPAQRARNRPGRRRWSAPQTAATPPLHRDASAPPTDSCHRDRVPVLRDTRREHEGDVAGEHELTWLTLVMSACRSWCRGRCSCCDLGRREQDLDAAASGAAVRRERTATLEPSSWRTRLPRARVVVVHRGTRLDRGMLVSGVAGRLLVFIRSVVQQPRR